MMVLLHQLIVLTEVCLYSICCKQHALSKVFKFLPVFIKEETDGDPIVKIQPSAKYLNNSNPGVMKAFNINSDIKFNTSFDELEIKEEPLQDDSVSIVHA